MNGTIAPPDVYKVSLHVSQIAPKQPFVLFIFSSKYENKTIINVKIQISASFLS